MDLHGKTITQQVRYYLPKKTWANVSNTKTWRSGFYASQNKRQNLMILKLAPKYHIASTLQNPKISFLPDTVNFVTIFPMFLLTCSSPVSKAASYLVHRLFSLCWNNSASFSQLAQNGCPWLSRSWAVLEASKTPLATALRAQRGALGIALWPRMNWSSRSWHDVKAK